MDTAQERLRYLLDNPESEDREQVYTELGADYDGITNSYESAKATIEALNQTIVEKDAEIQALKVHNYELLQAIGTSNNEPTDSIDDVEDEENPNVEVVF